MPTKPQARLSGSTGDTSRRTVILSLAAAASAAGVVGISAPLLARAKSDDGLTGSVQIRPVSANTVVVNMNNALQFVPNKISIKAGTTVKWRNVESYPHSVTADKSMAENPANVALPSGAKPFNSGRIDGGKSWQHTFKVAGTYRYFCIPHEGAGMLGTVVVT